ncbi:uncharacterized protein METZ01_LOCUS427963, partial [marine metagenome]
EFDNEFIMTINRVSKKIKSGDIIRGFTAPNNLSENLVMINKILSTSKTENQSKLPEKLLLSNYYSVLSDIDELTPVIMKENQLFLNSLRDSFESGFYELEDDSNKEDESIYISFFSDIESVVVSKEKIHDTRIDIVEGLVLRLLDRTKENELFAERQGLKIIIGNEKESKRKDKKRSKGNIILRGMSDKDINKSFFETNLTLFENLISRISDDL